MDIEELDLSIMFCGASCGELLSLGVQGKASERVQDPNVKGNSETLKK